MNKEYVTEFLATLMRWEICGKWWIESKPGIGKDVKTETWIMPIADFDPLKNIQHAFMVQDAIAKMEYTARQLYTHKLVGIVGKVKGYNKFATINATAEQRAIAAFRALATEEQQKEGGL